MTDDGLAQTTPNLIHRVEWLEYGKPCVTRDGPIKPGVDYRQLGSSSGFPAELRPYCQPRTVGATRSDLESRPSKASHSTVLRTVILPDGRVQSLMVREADRPENAQPESAQKGRHYTVAHYATSLTADPWTLWEALSVHRPQVIGFSSEDLNDDAHWTVSIRPPMPMPDDAPFLERALVYLLAGIPIAHAGFLPERDFFRRAWLLWCWMPERQRHLLSAGWGVADSLSGMLGFTWAERPASNVAVYCPTTVQNQGGWTDPLHRIRNRAGGKQTIDFQKAVLLPGELYYRDRIAGQNLLAKPPQRTFQPVATELGLKPVPSWLHPELQKRLRLPGVQLLDSARFNLVQRFFARDVLPKNGTLAGLASSLNLEETRLVVLQAALSVPEEALGRAEAFLWKLFKYDTGHTLSKYLRSQSGPRSQRAQMLVRLRKADPFGVRLLDLLGNLEIRTAADLLPDAAIRTLDTRLDNSLQEDAPEEVTNLHHKLFAATLPPVYSRWLRRRGSDLLLFLLLRMPITAAPLPSPHEQTLRSLDNLGDPRVQALLSWWQGDHPTDEQLATLLTFKGGRSQRFTRLFLRRWRTPLATRDSSLPWIPAVAPSANEPTLIKLARGQALEEDEIETLVEEICSGPIPVALLTPVAAVTLKHWRRLKHNIFNYRSAWTPILEAWPREVVYLLKLGEVGTMESAPNVEEAAAALTFDQLDISQMFDSWRSAIHRSEELASLMARRIWGWLRRSRQPIKSSRDLTGDMLEEHPLEILRKLSRGHWPNESCLNAEPKNAWKSSADRLASFIASGSIEPERSLLDGLWIEAEQSWQLKLLLLLFPFHTYHLTWRKRGLLVPIRDWLKGHLRKLPEIQQQDYELATLGFHSISYPGRDTRTYQEEMLATPLWATFKAVPFELQGDLYRALESYGKSPAQQAELCMKYIKAFQGEEKLLEARRKALKEFLIPVLSGQYHGKKYHSLNSEDIVELITRSKQPQKLVFTTRQGTEFKRDRWGYYIAKGEGPYLDVMKDSKGIVVSEAILDLIKGIFGSRGGGYVLKKDDLEAVLQELGVTGN